MRLFEPDRHEALAAPRWDEASARRTIEAIARDCETRFTPEELWPAHPLDTEGRSRTPYCLLYRGAVGVIVALDLLARRAMAAPAARFAPTLAAIDESGWWEREADEGIESYLMGRSGLLLARYCLDPAPEIADRLTRSISANERHPSRELLWGASGTMHAALAMHEWTGEARWAELFLLSARALERALVGGPGGCRLWDQDLYGRRSTYLGAGHGFAGNAGAIVRGLGLFAPHERSEWIERIVRAARSTVVQDGELANWAPSWGPSRPGFLVQWCHGAPGFVTALATLDDSRLDHVLQGAGELIWTAGPLVKGAGLCHGTAGNGYAFLKLFRRTGEERWLERARAFAMHAIAQSERHAATYGMRRYSLYTGDPGLAIYLAACIDGSDGWPSLDPEPRPSATAGL